MKKNILIVSLIAVMSFSLVLPALAGTFDQIADSLGIGGQIFRPNEDNSPRQGFTSAWATYVGGLAGILSALFLILIIYAGWLWMTARGNEEQVEKAKRIMTGAVIGLAVIIFARLIAQLAITYLGDATNLSASNE